MMSVGLLIGSCWLDPSNKEIAEQLQTKEISVKKHISNIFQKLKVHNRVQLIKEIQRLGCLQSETENESV